MYARIRIPPTRKNFNFLNFFSFNFSLCYNAPMEQTPNSQKRKKEYELTRQKYLEVEEQTRLVEILKRYSSTNPRDTTLIWVAMYTGARAQEVLNITSTDLVPGETKVWIRGLKSSRDRCMPLPKWLFEKLYSLIPDPSTKKLFPISYMRFYQIWLEYRPVEKKLHSLRHTYAIMAYRGTRDLSVVQAGLGHRNFRNTLIYSQYQSRAEDLERAMDVLPWG